MGKVTWSVDCPEAGFRRSGETPIEDRGYVRRLAEDLDRAVELYELRIENITLIKKNLELEEEIKRLKS